MIEEERPSEAARAWLKLHEADLIDNPDAFMGFMGLFVTLEKRFDDGSILRWFDRGRRWQFFDTARALDLAKWKGEA